MVVLCGGVSFACAGNSACGTGDGNSGQEIAAVNHVSARLRAMVVFSLPMGRIARAFLIGKLSRTAPQL